jgi:hypothetical protein
MKFNVVVRNMNTPDADLLADLRRVARELGRGSLSRSMYDDRGRFCSSTIRNRFGSWKAGLAAAMVGLAHSMGIGRGAVVADIRRVARELKTDRLPVTSYLVHGRFCLTIVHRCFGRWTDAAKAAGLKPVIHRAKNHAELFENLQQVWRKLGKQPTYDDLKPPVSKFGINTYIARFGTWSQTLRAFEDWMTGSMAPAKRKKRAKDLASMRSKITSRKTSREISWRLRYLILRRDQFRCRACGRSPATNPGLELQVDHKIPWRKGGEAVETNLQTLCKQCNGGKSDLPWEAASGR